MVLTVRYCQLKYSGFYFEEKEKRLSTKGIPGLFLKLFIDKQKRIA